jgi:hypothetical protein
MDRAQASGPGGRPIHAPTYGAALDIARADPPS